MKHNKRTITTEDDSVEFLPSLPLEALSVEVEDVVVDIRPLLNVHFSKETLSLIEQAVSANPNKVIKIAMYANSLSESELKEVLSRPIY